MLQRTTLTVLALFFLLPVTVHAQEQLSWDILAEAEYGRERDTGEFYLNYGEQIKQLEGKKVELTGYIMPLQQSREQAHFMLTRSSIQGCQYCIPGGPRSLIEVKANEPTEFGYDPVVVTGTFTLIEDWKLSGMFFRLEDARVQHQ